MKRPAKGIRLPLKRLSLVGRASALIVGELLATAICWIAAALVLNQSDDVLGLALLAWTTGLRHGLDADHISAIDNATRQLVSRGQMPITCGLWFSLGHSTIVIVVNIAIVISVDVYDKLDVVGGIGGIIGTSISASFLFLIAVLNIFFLHSAIKQRRSISAAKCLGLPVDSTEGREVQGGGCLVRILGPALRAVDKPWKLYPVGVLFGLGFDTASSIALLSISAIASKGVGGEGISRGRIVILPFLFTAGMSLVDSLDSILMLYAYACPQLRGEDGHLSLFLPDGEKHLDPPSSAVQVQALADEDIETAKVDQIQSGQSTSSPPPTVPCDTQTITVSKDQRVIDTKANTMSLLSISLTILSILVALSISLIEILGLIGVNCSSCQAAAESPDGGGLAGSWWRTWAAANDQSGCIGAAIVGVFVALLVGYYIGRYFWKRRRGSGKV